MLIDFCALRNALTLAQMPTARKRAVPRVSGNQQLQRYIHLPATLRRTIFLVF
jgi:hypothetical protein